MRLKSINWQKYKTYIILGSILLVFLLIFSGMFLVHASSTPEEIYTDNSELTLPVEKKEEIPIVNEVVVDVKGAVVNPGVYRLPDTSYVYQAIEMAGGLLENANTNVLNLSKHLTDSMVIIIYTNEEIAALQTPKKEIQYIEVKTPCECPDTMNDACISKPSNTETIVDSKDGKISLNTASAKELLNISGIGESKAKAIISYREEHGNFQNIEDIRNVSGIGEALFEKIKDQITV